MKAIFLIFIFCYLNSKSFAQSASILILPETGINSNKSNYQPDHRIVVKTAAENFGFMQKADPIEVGTYISESNGGYASYGTSGLYNLAFSTNAQSQQLTLNILNFAGIGGTPYSALHVYGGIKISEIKNYNDYAESSLLRVDNEGKISTTLQSYSYGLPRSAFVPIVTSGNNPIAESGEGGLYFTNADLSYGYFEAPINLPQGAIITGAEFYFIDNSSSDIFFRITSTDLGSKFDFNLLATGSSGALPGIRSISDNNINNGNGHAIFNDIAYRIQIYAQEGVTPKAWDSTNTQIVAAKLIYKY